MPHRIQPGLRYTLAQLVLRLLFGRKWHFISPWKMAGVGAAIVMLSPDGKRALIQQRAGNIEGVGLWGTCGGYLELAQSESFAEGLAREVWEESALHIPATQFDEPDWINLVHNQPKLAMWQHTGVGAWYFRTVPDDFISKLQTSNEVSAYKWINQEQLEEMWHDGQISGEENEHYTGINRAFAAAKHRHFPKLVLTV